MDGYKRGLISLPFMILLSASLSLSSFLCHKIIIENQILLNMKIVNQHIQHERKILEEIHCLLQCRTEDTVSFYVDGKHVVAVFDDEICYVSDSTVSMIIEVDYDEKKIRNVIIEK